jgi:TonB family protein
MRQGVWLTAVFVLFAGCASGPLLETEPVRVPPDEREIYWQPVQESVILRAPPGRKRADGPVRVVIGYLIDSRGRVHDAEILEEEPKGVFGQAALRLVRKLEFEPTPGNDGRTPVRTHMEVRLKPR